LTLPVVTLTQRHDLAMVVPGAGNTFERTPGNRARDARRRPMDTVHATDAWRLVVANTENGVPRDADLEAAQTLRTEGALAMVYANRANNVARDSELEPAHPILTGGTIAVVHLRRNQDGRRVEDPVGTVSAGGGHHGIVMRNNTARGDGGQMSTPTREPFRTLTAACHQSLVVPYQSEPHDPVEPSRTLTTRPRLALVVPPSTNGTCRDAYREPFVQVTETRPMLVELAEGGEA
jgi:hypothetical protein